MSMEEEFRLRSMDDFIKLGQLLKAAGLSETGAGAKEDILSGKVMVNGEAEYRRGKKLKDGDMVSFSGKTIKIIK